MAIAWSSFCGHSPNRSAAARSVFGGASDPFDFDWSASRRDLLRLMADGLSISPQLVGRPFGESAVLHAALAYAAARGTGVRVGYGLAYAAARGTGVRVGYGLAYAVAAARA